MLQSIIKAMNGIDWGNILNGLVSTAILALLTFGVNAMRKMLKDRDASREAMRTILKYNIVYIYEAALQRGGTSHMERECAERMGEIYHDKYHGNSYIADVLCEIRQMPINSSPLDTAVINHIKSDERKNNGAN